MRYIILFLTVTQSVTLLSQDLPFYETGGFGTDKLYGMAGDIYRVTNLHAEGEGSLRYGLELPIPRLIVFEIGGIIDLEEKDLIISNGQVTVAGHTAPYPGITLIKGALRIRADNVLIQHLTIRPGDGNYSEPVGWEPDGFSVRSRNVVLDHCSVSWSIDENMSVANGGNDVTFYRCIVAEGLSNSIHAKGEHSCGSLVYFNSKNVSIIGCLYAHNYRRHPRVTDGSEVLFANNVIYNYGIYASHIGANVGAGNPEDPGIADFIGNAYFKGIDGWDDYMVESHKGDFDKNNPPANGQAYLEDNIGLDRLTGQVLIPHDEYITVLNESHVRPAAFQALDAYLNIEKVLKYAGARPLERSETDTRIVESLINGTGSIIDSQDEVGGYPDFGTVSRTLADIPSGTTERRAWLDSISASLEPARDLDVSPLYSFVDENMETRVKSANTILMQCYPNPVSDRIHLVFRLDSRESIQISLVDMTGRRISLKNGRFDAGIHELSLPVGNLLLPEGIYLLVLTDGRNSVTKKVEVKYPDSTFNF